MTFEDDAGAYDQQDAEGFIKLNALRLRLLGGGTALDPRAAAAPRPRRGPGGKAGRLSPR